MIDVDKCNVFFRKMEDFFQGLAIPPEDETTSMLSKTDQNDDTIVVVRRRLDLSSSTIAFIDERDDAKIGLGSLKETEERNSAELLGPAEDHLLGSGSGSARRDKSTAGGVCPRRDNTTKDYGVIEKKCEKIRDESVSLRGIMAISSRTQDSFDDGAQILQSGVSSQLLDDSCGAPRHGKCCSTEQNQNAFWVKEGTADLGESLEVEILNFEKSGALEKSLTKTYPLEFSGRCPPLPPPGAAKVIFLRDESIASSFSSDESCLFCPDHD